MKKFFIMPMVLVLTLAFISTGYADKAVKAAEAKFKKARKAYIEAKEELSNAEIKALFIVGKTEKQEALDRVGEAKEAVKATKKAYKKTLSVLHEAEITRDAKIDRSPWR